MTADVCGECKYSIKGWRGKQNVAGNVRNIFLMGFFFYKSYRRGPRGRGNEADRPLSRGIHLATARKAEKRIIKSLGHEEPFLTQGESWNSRFNFRKVL